MTAPQRRPTVPFAVGENRSRIQTIERTRIEQRIQMREPMVWGWGAFPATIQALSPPDTPNLRFRGGFVYRLPDDPPYEMSLSAGERLVVSFRRSGPGFEWMGVRIHRFSMYPLDRFIVDYPNGSDPFGGAVQDIDYGSITWDDQFVTFLGVTNDDADTITWDAPVGAEQFSWNVAGVGHIGYAFNQFNTFTGAINASYSGSIANGSITFWYNGDQYFNFEGGVIGEAEYTGPPSGPPYGLRVELTEDVEPGETLLVMVATQDWDATETSNQWPTNENQQQDTTMRPYIYISNDDDPFTRPTPFIDKIPMFWAGNQWIEIPGPWSYDTDHHPFFGVGT